MLFNALTTLVAMMAATGVIAHPAPTPAPLARRQAGNTDVITLGGENGGMGINGIQCQGGTLTATMNLQASININNIHAYQPMADLGLPTIAASFFLNGQPATVQVKNSFNVGTNSASGNTWTFAVNDDGPHPGAQLSLGMCTPGAPLPQITVSFANVGGPVTVAGLPNGADGGPVVPAIGQIVPTIVNALPPQFVNNGGAVVVPPPPVAMTTPPPAANGVATVTITITSTVFVTVTAGAVVPPAQATPPPAVPATPATPPAAGGKVINQTIKTQFQAANCNNGKVTLNMLLMISQNGQQPMAENGLPTVTGALTFNGANANIVKVNQGNGVTSSGNTFTFTEQDDGPNVNMAFDTDVACQPNMATTKGFAVAYTAAPVTLNGVTSNVVIA
ncbi:hypothetical protein HDU76_004141 [Blyttiomyces sp. JEL0837]|nr:hypothetical protein HDU76_004141 [Blyttiomyces sp. JEL0837]